MSETKWIPTMPFTEWGFDLSVISHRTEELPECCRRRAWLHLDTSVWDDLQFECSICGARWAQIVEGDV